jgi:hypothetical protein
MSQDQQAGKTAPQIRGAHVAKIIQWIRDTYGESFYTRALARLSEEKRSHFQRAILSTGWYPLELWDSFLGACREEAMAHNGESEASFDRKIVYEAGGSRLFQTLYKFMFNVFKTTSIIQRMPMFHERTYDQGKCEILENETGSCLVRFSGPAEMYDSLRRFGPLVVSYLLDLSGAKTIKAEVPVNKTNQKECTIEIKAIYK